MLVKETYKDRGWAWVVVLGGFVSHFLTCGLEKGYSILYVEIITKYNASAAFAASLGGFSAAIRLLLVSLSNTYSEQRVVIAGGILSFSGLLITAWSPSLKWVFFGYGVIFGFGLTLVYTPSLIVCTSHFKKHRSTAVSVSLSGCGFGAIVLPYLIYFLLYQYGYTGAVFILASISLHYCVAGALFFSKLSNDGQDKPKGLQITSSSLNKTTLKKIILRIYSCFEVAKGFGIKLFLFSFVFNMMGSGPVTTLLIHFAEQHGVETINSVQLLVIEGSVQVVARILCGVIFDTKYVKPHRGIFWSSSIFFNSLIILFISLSSNLASLSGLMLLRGFFLAIYISQQSVIAADLCDSQPEYMKQTIGMTQISKGIGILLGSLFSGMIKDYMNNYRPAFLFLAAMQFCGFLMALVSTACPYMCQSSKRQASRVYEVASDSSPPVSQSEVCESESYQDIENMDKVLISSPESHPRRITQSAPSDKLPT